MNIEGWTMKHLGTCNKVTITKDSTIIVGGVGEQAVIDARTAEIKHHMLVTESRYEREKLQEHLEKIHGAVAVISVGGASDTEVSEAKDLFEDALSSTRTGRMNGSCPEVVLRLSAAQAPSKIFRPKTLTKELGSRL
jgi:chaperonin GroEL